MLFSLNKFNVSFFNDTDILSWNSDNNIAPAAITFIGYWRQRVVLIKLHFQIEL